jgi:hypothetical protein
MLIIEQKDVDSQMSQQLIITGLLDNVLELDYGRGDPLRWPPNALYQLKLALTSPTGCGRSVGIVRLRLKPRNLVF